MSRVFHDLECSLITKESGCLGMTVKLGNGETVRVNVRVLQLVADQL